MTTNDFEILKKYLLEQNKFFNSGFANLVYEPISGRLRSTINEDNIAAGIDDRFGNYFYIRSTGSVNYRRSTEQLSNCRNSQDVYTSATIVCVINEGVPNDLNLAVLNSLLLYTDADIKPVRSLLVGEDVIRKEYANMKAKSLEYILQNLGKKTIISLDFEFGLTHHPSQSCNFSPCKTC